MNIYAVFHGTSASFMLDIFNTLPVLSNKSYFFIYSALYNFALYTKFIQLQCFSQKYS